MTLIINIDADAIQSVFNNHWEPWVMGGSPDRTKSSSKKGGNKKSFGGGKKSSKGSKKR